MSSTAGGAEAQPAGSAPAAGQPRQAADAFQHRGHPQQALCEKELLPERSGIPHLPRREVALGVSQPDWPGAAPSVLSALRAGGASQQNLHWPGGQRPAGCRG